MPNPMGLGALCPTAFGPHTYRHRRHAARSGVINVQRQLARLDRLVQELLSKSTTRVLTSTLLTDWSSR